MTKAEYPKISYIITDAIFVALLGFSALGISMVFCLHVFNDKIGIGSSFLAFFILNEKFTAMAFLLCILVRIVIWKTGRMRYFFSLVGPVKDMKNRTDQ